MENQLLAVYCSFCHTSYFLFLHIFLLSLFFPQSIWTQSAISAFQRICCERTLVAAIHSYQEDFLLLFLCDTNTEEDVYIHLALQKEGHALPSVTAYGLVWVQIFI